MTLQELLETVPVDFWATAEPVEIHIFEDGKCFAAEHVVTEKVDAKTMVIDIQKGERVL